MEGWEDDPIGVLDGLIVEGQGVFVLSKINHVATNFLLCPLSAVLDSILDQVVVSQVQAAEVLGSLCGLRTAFIEQQAVLHRVRLLHFVHVLVILVLLR